MSIGNFDSLFLPPSTETPVPGGGEGTQDKKKRLSGAQRRKLIRQKLLQLGLPLPPRNQSKKKKGGKTGGVQAGDVQAAWGIVTAGDDRAGGLLPSAGIESLTPGTSSEVRTEDVLPPQNPQNTKLEDDKLYKEFFHFMSTKGRPDLASGDSRLMIEQPKFDDSTSQNQTSADYSWGDRFRNECSTWYTSAASLPIEEPFSNKCYLQIAIIVDTNTRKLYRSEVEMIELSLYKHITAYDSLQFHGTYRESEAVVFICDDDHSAQWLVKTVPFISPWPGASLKAEPWCKRLHSTELFFEVPSMLSSLPWATLCEKITQQNLGLLTSEWKLIVEDDRIRVCCIDKASLRELRKRQFKAFLGFVQIEFKLIADASA